jgi:hypothetical protein
MTSHTLSYYLPRTLYGEVLYMPNHIWLATEETMDNTDGFMLISSLSPKNNQAERVKCKGRVTRIFFFIVCILLCVIYKIYDIYSKDSLHNNISERTTN